MMWDATQAYANDGFIKDVRKALGPANDSGSSSQVPCAKQKQMRRRKTSVKSLVHWKMTTSSMSLL
jgi:chitinase